MVHRDAVGFVLALERGHVDVANDIVNLYAGHERVLLRMLARYVHTLLHNLSLIVEDPRSVEEILADSALDMASMEDE